MTHRSSAVGSDLLDEIFEATARHTATVLQDLPHNLLDARRMLTRELGIDPSPEQLQTVVRMAHESPLEGRLAEWPRQALVLLVRAHRVLHSVRNGLPLDPTRVRLDSRIVSRVIQENRRLDEELRTIVSMVHDLPIQARNFLLQTGQAFEIPRRELLAVLHLAPRLDAFASATSAEELLFTAPGLSADEVRIVRAARTEESAESDGPLRVLVDALALRSLIEEDLDRWSELLATAEPSGEQLEAVREDLRRDVQTYRVVSEQLQSQQDTALTAGVESTAEELRAVGRSLFSCYLKLAPALRQAESARAADGPAAEADADAASVGQLLRECEAADEAAVAAAGSRVSREELYLDALKRTRDPERLPELPQGSEDLRRERRRMRALLSAAALLAIVSITVNVLLFGLGRRPPSLEVDANTFSPAAPVGAVESLGPVVFTDVPTWKPMDLDERLESATRIGQEASVQGATSVFLLDQDGRLAATWSREQGTTLIDAN